LLDAGGRGRIKTWICEYIDHQRKMLWVSSELNGRCPFEEEVAGEYPKSFWAS
jgi:hypothetical protein